MRRAVFLDRDGVLNALVYRPAEGAWDSPSCPEELRLLPGVAEAVRRLREMGFLALVVSNQPGVAKGKFTEEALQRLTACLCRSLEEAGAPLDGVYYCLHHPQAVVERYRALCGCRKPRPGLLLRASQEWTIALPRSYLIGDRRRDIEAGRAAGCRTILLRGSPACDLPDGGPVRPDRECRDLLEAVGIIQGEEGAFQGERRIGV